MEMQPEILLELLHSRMPYGKYKDKLIRDIPVHYLEWLYREGFPNGRIGMLLATMHVIKTNGLNYLLEDLEKRIRKKR